MVLSAKLKRDYKSMLVCKSRCAHTTITNSYFIDQKQSANERNNAFLGALELLRGGIVTAPQQKNKHI